MSDKVAGGETSTASDWRFMGCGFNSQLGTVAQQPRGNCLHPVLLLPSSIIWYLAKGW